MELLDAIMTRRSTRVFEDRAVPDDVLETILRAGMAAPSAGNEQAWRFVVLKDRDVRERVSKCTPYAGLLAEAPLGIAVCGAVDAQKHEGYWVQDCAAATQNMLLAAHDLGLGCVWLGFYPVADRCDGAARVLGLPDNIVPMSVVALGYAAESKPPADRYDPGKVFVDHWTGE
jgi:nitroreductase